MQASFARVGALLRNRGDPNASDPSQQQRRFQRQGHRRNTHRADRPQLHGSAPQRPERLRLPARSGRRGRHRTEMAALAEGLQVGRARSPRMPRIPPIRPSGRASTRNDFPIQSFLWGDYGSQPGTQYRFRIQPMYGTPGALTTDAKDEIDIAITTEAEWPEARPTACGSTAAPSPARSSPRNSVTRRRRTSTTRPIRKSNGCRAACSKPAWNTSTRPSRAMRCGSPPMNSPIRRFSTRFKALLDKGIDVQIVYHDTTDAGQPNETAMKAAWPAHQRPEDHLPALEDQDPAQQIHRPAQERRRSGRSVDGLDQLHAVRLPRPDQCRPSHRRRSYRQAVFRVLEGREDRSGTGRCARADHGADTQSGRGDRRPSRSCRCSRRAPRPRCSTGTDGACSTPRTRCGSRPRSASRRSWCRRSRPSAIRCASC